MCFPIFRNYFTREQMLVRLQSLSGSRLLDGEILKLGNCEIVSRAASPL